MIRSIAYAVCLAAILWIVLASLQFRQAIRTSLMEAHARIQKTDPEHANDIGKKVNSYYEDVYKSLPSVIAPACILIVGVTVLLLSGPIRKPKTDTPANLSG